MKYLLTIIIALAIHQQTFTDIRDQKKYSINVEPTYMLAKTSTATGMNCKSIKD
jgi:hypothetical protein